MNYKWRNNLTLKDKFKKTTNIGYTCIHDDTPSDIPCEHPSHYQGVTIYLTRKELEALAFPYNGFTEEFKRKIKNALDETEYPFKEGY